MNFTALSLTLLAIASLTLFAVASLAADRKENVRSDSNSSSNGTVIVNSLQTKVMKEHPDKEYAQAVSSGVYLAEKNRGTGYDSNSSSNGTDIVDNLKTMVMKDHPSLIANFLHSFKLWDKEYAEAFSIGFHLGERIEILKLTNDGMKISIGVEPKMVKKCFMRLFKDGDEKSLNFEMIFNELFNSKSLFDELQNLYIGKRVKKHLLKRRKRFEFESDESNESSESDESNESNESN